MCLTNASSFRALHTQPVNTSVALRCGDAAVAAVTVAICYIYVEFFCPVTVSYKIVIVLLIIDNNYQCYYVIDN